MVVKTPHLSFDKLKYLKALLSRNKQEAPGIDRFSKK